MDYSYDWYGSLKLISEDDPNHWSHDTNSWDFDCGDLRRNSDVSSSDDGSHEDFSSDDNISDGNSSDEGSSDEDPSDEDPSDEDPSDEDPSDEDPSDEDPSDEDPSDEDPSDEDPSDEDPSDEDSSSEDSSSEDFSSEDFGSDGFSSDDNISSSSSEDNNSDANSVIRSHPWDLELDSELLLRPQEEEDAEYLERGEYDALETETVFSDEEEVLYDLDYFALNEIPEKLRGAMLDLHNEREKRLLEENPDLQARKPLPFYFWDSNVKKWAQRMINQAKHMREAGIERAFWGIRHDTVLNREGPLPKWIYQAYWYAEGKDRDLYILSTMYSDWGNLDPYKKPQYQYLNKYDFHPTEWQQYLEHQWQAEYDRHVQSQKDSQHGSQCQGELRNQRQGNQNDNEEHDGNPPLTKDFLDTRYRRLSNVALLDEEDGEDDTAATDGSFSSTDSLTDGLKWYMKKPYLAQPSTSERRPYTFDEDEDDYDDVSSVDEIIRPRSRKRNSIIPSIRDGMEKLRQKSGVFNK